MGRPGRTIVKKFLPDLRKDLELDFVIANGENAAGGKGITQPVATELFECGIDVLTGGNHTWSNREALKFIDEEERLLRPANYPENAGVPGRGSGVFRTNSGLKIGIINLQGRVFMTPIDCPFQRVRREVEHIRRETNIIIVDFHAEATSEKVAMGWFLDGDVSAVIGTHTHVQTADEQILPGGTAYITDAGMTGGHSGVIGVKKDIVLEGMLSRLPVRHKLATGELRLHSVIIEIDAMTGRAISIERITRKL